jgi:hypothetical protein
MSAEVNIRSFSTEDVKELNKIRRSEGVFETILSLKEFILLSLRIKVSIK